MNQNYCRQMKLLKNSAKKVTVHCYEKIKKKLFFSCKLTTSIMVLSLLLEQ